MGAPLWELSSLPAINPCVVCAAANRTETTRNKATQRIALQFAID